ncbi:hypothetical protein K1719_024896 [Acacia pycnantha]|nr:hypothetical protein K1719_024896 [Acacia pycnantha]
MVSHHYTVATQFNYNNAPTLDGPFGCQRCALSSDSLHSPINQASKHRILPRKLNIYIVMEGERRKRKLENNEEESEEEKLEKFYELIRSTKDVRDRLANNKDREDKKDGFLEKDKASLSLACTVSRRQNMSPVALSFL